MINAHVSTQWLLYKQELRNILMHVCKTIHIYINMFVHERFIGY